MTEKKASSPARRFLRMALIFFGIVIAIVIGLHIWFVNNARGMLQRIVTEKSHGKLKLDLDQLSFDFLSNKLQVREVAISSTDTISQPLSYNIRFRKLTVKVHSFWPLLIHNELLLDSIKLHDPVIQVNQWRKDTTQEVKNDLSVPQQMGTLYNSMLDGLDAFGIRRIMINNATLVLVNKMRPDFKPVVISKIYFDLFQTRDAARKRDEYIEGEKSIDLTTSNQTIFLPSGRHQLAFKSFALHLFQKRVELDSCTVTAVTTDSSSSNYKIFFKKLQLIGVDFEAMYRHNLIRADSVYCEEPYFDINLDPGSTAGKKKKARPDLEKTVRELTGDLDFRYVGVKDAGIHIDILGAKKRSLFNSNRDNFEMRGLRINADSSRPVVVQRFDMLVRDYHLYNADSSTAYTFDSIHFHNNKVVLNNFTVVTEPSRTKRTRSERNFNIPYFELTGMDWFELAFEQNLKADEAVMTNPVIYYKKIAGPKSRRPGNFFDALQTFDSLMTLDKISIINGQLKMQLGRNSNFSLENVNLSLHTNDLMKSTNREGLRKAVEFLSFSDGVFRINDITARLKQIRYTGKNLIHAQQALVTSSRKSVTATVNDVYLDNLLIDDELENVVIDGVRWKNGSITLNSKPSDTRKNEKGLSLFINNISGGPTSLRMNNPTGFVQTKLKSLRVESLHKNGSAPLEVRGLVVTGGELKMQQPNVDIAATGYSIRQMQPSTIQNLVVKNIKGQDCTLLSVPVVHFVPDVNAMLKNDLHFSSLSMPLADILVRKRSTTSDSSSKKKPDLRIDHLELTGPSIDVQTFRNDSVTKISLPRAEGSRLEAAQIAFRNGAFSAGQVHLFSSRVLFTKPNGTSFGVDSGRVDLTLADVGFGKNNGIPYWNATVRSLDLDHPNDLRLGKNTNRLVLQKIMVGDLNLSSTNVVDMKQLFKANLGLWIRSGTGQYVDSTTTLRWFNANYESSKKLFRLDSFEYVPTQPRDSIVARSAYQTDYITFHSGPVSATAFDLARYERDSAIFLNRMEINNPFITIYRDKKPPFHSGRIKPLPTEMLQMLKLPVSVGSVALIDGNLEYTEKHPRTRAEGTLALRRLNGEISNIRNRSISPTDSLTLQLSAYVMDSAFINLRVRQSYADTLDGFLMTLRMRPTSLSFLNPVLAPLSNVKITSGMIDSFQLRAIGKDALAFGEMRMYYHNLKIKLVKDGDQEKSSFFGNILSALVNTFLVKKNNNGRVGLVYFERLRDRSFFNYIVKTTFSGIATSVGVVKNRKYMKKYKKLLAEKNLPEFDFK